MLSAKVPQRLTETGPEATASQINADIKSALVFCFGNPVAIFLHAAIEESEYLE
jgi:hypothetical protein